jgi:RNA polymerase sigma-70 factor (ECF subfamily)
MARTVRRQAIAFTFEPAHPEERLSACPSSAAPPASPQWTGRTACDDDFASELIAIVPFMRAVARGLTRERAEADDLVQEALLKAWAKQQSFRPGTSMKAWTATIIRNYYRETRRRSWRLSQLDSAVAEETLEAHDNPSAPLELDDVRRALHALPLIHREVLMLLTGGLSYLEVAQICDCAEGTVKSRASRARKALQALINGGRPARDSVRPATAADVLEREIRETCVAGRARREASV